MFLTHLHTVYSLSDSLITSEKLIKRLNELDMKKVAITDHGNLLHIQEFRSDLSKAGIMHFPGCEFYYCDDVTNKEQRKSYHLTIIAKTEEGIKNLYALSSLSYEQGFYYRPRIDFNMLKDRYKGLVVSSACLKGQIDTLLLENKEQEAINVAQKFKDLFGDKFFIEIMPHNIQEQITVNPLLVNLAKKLNIKLITTCDSHYAYADEVQNRRMLLVMNKSGWAKDEEVGTCDSLYMMSKDNMKRAFKICHTNIDEKIIDEAIENTELVLDGEQPNVAFDKARFPKIQIPSEYSNVNDYFYKLIINGLVKKGLSNKNEYVQRMIKEAKIIVNSGFANYFLVMYDVFNWCHENDIYCGPGRGSAGGSLIAYLLGITRIDPIKYGLIFERFYNEGRNTGTAENAPDIDSDFESAKRELVIKHLEEKYGFENISQICSISYIKLKSGIKDVARALEIPIETANKISKEIAWETYETLDEAVEKDEKAKKLVAQYPELFKYVKIFCGIPRQTGKHAAGIVIGDQKIGNVCPMMLATVNGEKFLVSQFDKNSIKHTGLIKYDFLGLTTMDFIKALDIQIELETGHRVDWDNLDLNDTKVYDYIFSLGETDYIFQCDSDLMKTWLKKMQCKNIEDLSAMNTLVRPASLITGATDRYIKKRFNELKNDFNMNIEADKIFADITKDTYGEIIYDEQKMQMVVRIGGISLKDANLVRKQPERWADRHDELQDIFLKNALEKGWDNDKAKLYWEMVKQYSFCKAHSMAYSILGFWCAWAKYYHPIAFMKAMFMISSTDSSADKFNVVDAIKFAKRLGYKVLPVNINKSKSIFAFDDNKHEIYFPYKSVKGISEAAGEVIQQNVPYNDFNDFLEKTKSYKQVNKRIIMPLIELRAFDDLNCLEQIKKYYINNFSLSANDDKELRQSFKQNKDSNILTKEERILYKQKLQKIANEKFNELLNTPLHMNELKNLGIILSTDLDKYKDYVIGIDNDIENHSDNEQFVIKGFLIEFKNVKSKKGSYYGYIKIVDEHFNGFEIITRSTVIDSINQRNTFTLEKGQYIKAVVKKSGNRLFLVDEGIIALDDCIIKY